MKAVVVATMTWPARTMAGDAGTVEREECIETGTAVSPCKAETGRGVRRVAQCKREVFLEKIGDRETDR